VSSDGLSTGVFLSLSVSPRKNVFSALISASLRLCVE